MPEEIQVAWVSGMPRSGTTWLSQIFASSPDVRLKFCPLFSYEFKNILDENSSTDDWLRLFSDVYTTNSEFLDQDYLREKGLVPVFEEKKENPGHLFIKSTRFHNLVPHILMLNENIQFVHIVRHPCATIYSWLTTPGEFPQHADPLAEWKSGDCRKTGPGEFWGFNDWKKVTTQALRLTEIYPGRFKIVSYEELIKAPQACSKDLFNYFNIPYQEQTNKFIELTHSKHDENKRSVYKNPESLDRWLTGLDQSIVSTCLNELRGTELEQFL